MSSPRIIYAANRKIGLDCLRLLIEAGVQPAAVLVADGAQAECADEMRRLAGEAWVCRGLACREPESLEVLKGLAPDYIISVHFPYIIPESLLALPAIGALNLHPAYLPFNRGWHTPSWAILEGTPYGATLHWIDTGVDTGPIALQSKLDVRPDETADSLYQRVLELERKVFAAAIPLLVTNSLPRIPQNRSKGTTHRKADLSRVQELDVNEHVRVGALIDRLRALTTNRWDEAAFFVLDGRKYRVRIAIQEEE